MDKTPKTTIFELAAKIAAFCNEVDKGYTNKTLKKGDLSAPIK